VDHGSVIIVGDGQVKGVPRPQPGFDPTEIALGKVKSSAFGTRTKNDSLTIASNRASARAAALASSPPM
jgi:hypothetical protein